MSLQVVVYSLVAHIKNSCLNNIYKICRCIENYNFKNTSEKIKDSMFESDDIILRIKNTYKKGTEDNTYLLPKEGNINIEFLHNLLENLVVYSSKDKIENIPLNEIHGVLASKETEHKSFNDFKNDEWKRNQEKKKYNDYEALKSIIFTKDTEEQKSTISSVRIHSWNKKVYFNNSDKSHRVALLCVWDEKENKKDSVSLKTINYQINPKSKQKLLDNFYGYFIDAEDIKFLRSIKFEHINICLASCIGDNKTDLCTLWISRQIPNFYLKKLCRILDKKLISINNILMEFQEN